MATTTAYESVLLALPRFAQRGSAAMHPGLANMEALMQAMERPHEAFKSIHVAGTNGKGSMASLLAAIATAAGRHTGLHTSPHLWHLRERMRIDGIPAPEAWISQAVARYQEVFETLRPSFFEATTALSFLYFAESNVDMAIVEVGLGGRLDATNILRPQLSIITNIAHDHTDVLGKTLRAIAQEKGGIIKPGVPVLTGAMEPEVLKVLLSIAKACPAPLVHAQEDASVHLSSADAHPLTLTVRTPLRTYPNLAVGLAGEHQRHNVLLAVRAAEILLPEIATNPAAITQGLKKVCALSGLRGRLEELHTHPLILADVAHNPAALQTVLACAKQREKRLFVLFAALQDKNIAAMAQLLAAVHAQTFVCHMDSNRAMPPRILADNLQKCGVSVLGHGSLLEGQKLLWQQITEKDVCLIAGSHFLVADAIRMSWSPPST